MAKFTIEIDLDLTAEDDKSSKEVTRNLTKYIEYSVEKLAERKLVGDCYTMRINGESV